MLVIRFMGVMVCVVVKLTRDWKATPPSAFSEEESSVAWSGGIRFIHTLEGLQFLYGSGPAIF